MTGRRHLLLGLAAAGLAAGLAGCGRKGDVRPPENEKSAYTYPRNYPSPDSVVPKTVSTPKAEEEGPEKPPQRLERKKKDRLSPFPLSPDRTQSYGS